MFIRPKRRPVVFGIHSDVIAIDVDGTLLVRGELNTRLVEWCEDAKGKGKSLILWSARGKDYAQRIADRFEVTHLFDVIIGKPEAIIDDKGWSWIKYTRVVRSLDIDDDVTLAEMDPSEELPESLVTDSQSA